MGVVLDANPLTRPCGDSTRTAPGPRQGWLTTPAVFIVPGTHAVAAKDTHPGVSPRGCAQSTATYFFSAYFNQVPVLLFRQRFGGTVGVAGARDHLRHAHRHTRPDCLQFALAAELAYTAAREITVYDADATRVFSRTAPPPEPPVTATKSYRRRSYHLKYTPAPSGNTSPRWGTVLSWPAFIDPDRPYATSTSPAAVAHRAVSAPPPGATSNEHPPRHRKFLAPECTHRRLRRVHARTRLAADSTPHPPSSSPPPYPDPGVRRIH